MENMIASMTGFGRGVAERDGLQVRVELRSVNSRFFEAQVRAGGGLQEHEAVVRELLQSRLSRGKVSAQIDIDLGEGDTPLPVLNEAVAQRYARELGQLRQVAGLDHEPDWAAWVRLPGLFVSQSVQAEPALLGELVELAAVQALEDFTAMRETEGLALERDLRARVAAINARLEQISELTECQRGQIEERLRERLAALLEPGQIAEERLAMEVVLLAERSDITEEIVRFRSHNDQFTETLDTGGDVGRRLNFLLQEMNREANTINSKASAAEILHLAVEVKEEVEKLREQVQNLA
jgi:uncharacterized protein (TIGR00255 family)